MLTETDLIELVKKHRPADLAHLGNGNVRTIIEDFAALGPSERHYERPDGGHHFDLMAAMGVLVGVLQLFVAVGDIVVRERRRHEEESTEKLIHHMKPELDKLDFSRVPDRERLIINIVEIIERRGH